MKTRAARSTRTKRDKRSRLRFSVLKAWWNQVHAQFLLMHVLCIWKKHTFFLATKLLKLMSLSTFCYFLVFWSKMRGLQTCQQFEVLSRQGHRVKQLRMGSQKTTDTFIWEHINQNNFLWEKSALSLQQQNHWDERMFSSVQCLKTMGFHGCPVICFFKSKLMKQLSQQRMSWV